ncbi:MAG: redoxin domain-containing protein [Salegentibacter sp.]
MKTLKILTVLTLLVAFTAFAFKSDILEESGKASCGEIGAQAARFRLMDCRGKKWSFDDFPEAKGFILVFTSKKCAFSRVYEKRIANLNKKYGPKGFPVITVDPLMESFVLQKQKGKEQQKERNYPLLADPGAAIFRKYGADKIPQAFVLHRKNGKMIIEYKGAIDSHYRHSSSAKQQYVASAVDALLKGEEMAITSTRSTGCPVPSS